MTTSPAPSEETLPPRFDDAFLTKSAGALGVLLIAAVTVLWAAYAKGGLFKNPTSAGRNTVGFVFFLLAVVSLVLGAFFALVESRRPVATTQEVSATAVTAPGRNLTGVAGAVDVPVTVVTKVVDAFSGRKASVILFATAVSFALLAAATSGNVSISVGTGNSAPATPSPSTTP